MSDYLWLLVVFLGLAVVFVAGVALIVGWLT